MSAQLSIAFERRDRGIARAAAHEPLLEEAREIARALAAHGPITIDDVQAEVFRRHGRYLANAAGAIFRGREWVHTGEWRTSTRPTNHAHQNRIWRLRT